MNLNKLFDLFNQEEKRRYIENLNGPEPFGVSKMSNIYKAQHDSFKSMVENHEFGKTTDTGENLDAIKKFDLSVEEASIIFMYTTREIHSEVNLQLRNRPNHLLDRDINEYCVLLDQSLDKMPSYDKGVVFRDIRNPDKETSELFEHYESNIGKEIVQNDFMSSHIKNNWSSDKKSDVQLIINTQKNSNGKDLRELCFNVDETEVLFKKGTHFIVDSINKNNHKVELTEICSNH